jgi:hypothetical protein
VPARTSANARSRWAGFAALSSRRKPSDAEDGGEDQHDRGSDQELASFQNAFRVGSGQRRGRERARHQNSTAISTISANATPAGSIILAFYALMPDEILNASESDRNLNRCLRSTAVQCRSHS